MRRPAALRISLTAVLVTAASAPAQSLDPALTNVTWRVVEIAGQPASHAETVKFSDSKILAKSACNHFSASVRQSDGKLEIGKGMLTLMGCKKDRMLAERRLFDALREIRGYALSDNALSLTGADSNTVLRLTK